jgi:hypothetical protein
MFGRTLLSTNNVLPTRVSADNQPIYKPGGITIDWANTVAAPGSPVTLPDGSVIQAGSKYLRYGQVMTKITLPATDVVTINGTPTGGTFTVSAVVNGGTIQTTSAIAFNATAATLQAALVALTNVGAGGAIVTGSAGGPYTITFANALGPVTVTASGASLTGGSTPTATVAQSAPGGNLNWFGPYDPAATDGRATLTKGSVFVLDELILQYDAAASVSPENTQTGRAIEGGLIFIDRVLQSGVATHTLAAGPTLAELLAVLAFRVSAIN